MSRYLGRVTVRANGVVLDSKPGATLDLGGIARAEVVNEQNMGFSETKRPSRIECVVAMKVGDSIEPLRNITDSTAVFECDTGQQYVIKGVYTVETLTLSSEGTKLVLAGEPAEELVS